MSDSVNDPGAGSSTNGVPDSPTSETSPQKGATADRQKLQEIIRKKVKELQEQRANKSASPDPVPHAKKRRNEKAPPSPISSTPPALMSSIPTLKSYLLKKPYAVRDHKSNTETSPEPSLSFSTDSSMVEDEDNQPESIPGGATIKVETKCDLRLRNDIFDGIEDMENLNELHIVTPAIKQEEVLPSGNLPKTSVSRSQSSDDCRVDGVTPGTPPSMQMAPVLPPNPEIPGPSRNVPANTSTVTAAQNGNGPDSQVQADINSMINGAIHMLEDHLRQLKKLTTWLRAPGTPATENTVTQAIDVLAAGKEVAFNLYEKADAAKMTLMTKYSEPAKLQAALLQKATPTTEDIADYFEVLIETVALAKRPYVTETWKGVLMVQITRLLRILGYFMCSNKLESESELIFNNATKILLAKPRLLTKFTVPGLRFQMLTFWQSIRENRGAPSYEQGALLDHETLGPARFMERVEEFKMNYDKVFPPGTPAQPTCIKDNTANSQNDDDDDDCIILPFEPEVKVQTGFSIPYGGSTNASVASPTIQAMQQLQEDQSFNLPPSFQMRNNAGAGETAGNPRNANEEVNKRNPDPSSH